MIKAPLYNVKGEKAGEIELPESVFDVPSNDTLLHQVYVAISANLRSPIAHTKDRSERAGTGKKPWRQKGTGRARIGQVRAPHWRKGGIVFGPTKDRNFSKEANRKMRQKALRIALSEKLRADRVRFVEGFSFEDRKTKSFLTLLSGLGIDMGKRTLIGFDRQERETERMSRNIDRVENVLSENMSVYDLLQSEYLVITKQSVSMFSERFSEKEGSSVKN
ncbi:MAG: 50S ribosomal protein L4 [Candidatus Moranbacteria bacterium]|nr:50S ribosomal protein L4 [Candidatus Moranbacteria bacterium]NTW75635.1 50S ribosomal protein L4 [Candidatus Moranbacteria bacterium]